MAKRFKLLPPPSLVFTSDRSYVTARPTLVVILRSLQAGNPREIRVSAVLDTGATHCFFDSSFGTQLGFPFNRQPTSQGHTAIGAAMGWKEEIEIEIVDLSLRFELEVSFLNAPSRRAIVGPTP